MPIVVTPAVSTGTMWSRKAARITAGTSLMLLIASWCCADSFTRLTWPSLALTSLAALLAGGAYALNARPQLGRLSSFGKDKVLVRSLDEWTLYQYDLSFEQASPAQQNEALSHYQVGPRLFPARPKDIPAKKGALNWVLLFVSASSFITLSKSMHGWYSLLLFVVFYAWIFLCMRLSKRLWEQATPNTVITLGLF